MCHLTLEIFHLLLQHYLRDWKIWGPHTSRVKCTYIWLDTSNHLVLKGSSVNHCIIAIGKLGLRVFRTCRWCSDIKRDYKHVLGNQQKMGKYWKYYWENEFDSQNYTSHYKCCLFHRALSWERHQKGKNYVCH